MAPVRDAYFLRRYKEVKLYWNLVCLTLADQDGTSWLSHIDLPNPGAASRDGSFSAIVHGTAVSKRCGWRSHLPCSRGSPSSPGVQPLAEARPVVIWSRPNGARPPAPGALVPDALRDIPAATWNSLEALARMPYSVDDVAGPRKRLGNTYGRATDDPKRRARI